MYIDELKKALNEENEMLASQFDVASDKADITAHGEVSFTGESKIALQLTMQMPSVTKQYLTANTYNDLSEAQFNEASDKIHDAVKEVIENFNHELQQKLASYGLE